MFDIDAVEKDYNEDDKRRWIHKFADEFFDLFVKYELKTMGERIMPEGEIYAIAYDNSLIAANEFHSTDPKKAADLHFRELMK